VNKIPIPSSRKCSNGYKTRILHFLMTCWQSYFIDSLSSTSPIKYHTRWIIYWQIMDTQHFICHPVTRT
jgi:hypothetical protein